MYRAVPKPASPRRQPCGSVFQQPIATCGLECCDQNTMFDGHECYPHSSRCGLARVFVTATIETATETKTNKNVSSRPQTGEPTASAVRVCVPTTPSPHAVSNVVIRTRSLTDTGVTRTAHAVGSPGVFVTATIETAIETKTNKNVSSRPQTGEPTASAVRVCVPTTHRHMRPRML